MVTQGAFFTADELDTLRNHGIVIHAQRVIFDAQPPMTPAQIAALQAHCAGPLPPSLIALWQQTAGGRLDYDLNLRMNDCAEDVSWCELFWNGSDGGEDLQGWIAHEKQSTGDDLLERLPIGGFEETDRIYAVVDPRSANNGHIVAWKLGLPAAWSHAMHDDGEAVIASDLPGALGALHLHEDPLDPAGDYFTGQTLLEYLDERHEDHALPLDLADKLVHFYRRAMVDWRTPLREGRIGTDGALAHIALRHAVATDDAALVDALAAADVRFDAPLQGSGTATDLAVGHGAYEAAAALVNAGAPVSADALEHVEGALSPELTAQLLAAGAMPSATAMAQCVACGAPASARLIGDALAADDTDVRSSFATARDALLAELEAALAEVHRGELAHYLGPEGLIRRVEHLRSFEL
jgi:hypothetical protein